LTDRTKKLSILILPAFVVWVVDQVTKHWIRYSMEYHRYDIIEGWLAFNYTQNPGMALGMDWISTPTISTIAIIATIGIAIYLFRTLDKTNYAYLFCMGLILGGATGNITDRLVMGLIEGYGGVLHGHVIDFIHFTLVIGDRPVFPYIFNVADVAISTSIIAMLLFHKRILPDVEDVERVGEVVGESAPGSSKPSSRKITKDTANSTFSGSDSRQVGESSGDSRASGS